MNKRAERDMFYFRNMAECVDIAEEAVKELLDALYDFDPATLPERLKQMHKVENAGDQKKHELMEVVSNAFITPIEREDIIAISNILDDIVDGVEDILIQIYVTNVTELRYDIIPSCENAQKCIQALKKLILEFPNYKRSDTIHKLIIDVNGLEEQGDRRFMDSMVRLYREDSLDPVVRWISVYQCIENVMDACEDAADTVQTVMMKNM
ncbi:MAG: DUF47 family protein [Oscillospiraceae bacterium]|nr:DUF47 family protein [Oscillospiraceae bacterium]